MGKVRNFDKFEVGHYYVYTGNEKGSIFWTERMYMVLDYRICQCDYVEKYNPYIANFVGLQPDYVFSGFDFRDGIDNWIEVESPLCLIDVLDKVYCMNSQTIEDGSDHRGWINGRQNHFILKRELESEDDKQEEEKTTMSKYKVGDKVTIRKDINHSFKTPNYHVNSNMINMAGKEFTIKRVKENGTYILDLKNTKIFDHYITWWDELFEEPTQTHKYKVGDVVLLREDLTSGEYYRERSAKNRTPIIIKEVRFDTGYDYSGYDGVEYWGYSDWMIKGLASEIKESKVKEFLEGDIVECVDGSSIGITKGKHYTVLKNSIPSPYEIEVLDDLGVQREYSESRFVLVIKFVSSTELKDGCLITKERLNAKPQPLSSGYERFYISDNLMDQFGFKTKEDSKREYISAKITF